MYYFKLIGVCVMAIALIHFFMWEIRDMISKAAITGFKAPVDLFSFKKWWTKKPFNCVSCLSMWTSLVLFIMLGDPMVFSIYVGAIYLEK